MLRLTKRVTIASIFPYIKENNQKTKVLRWIGENVIKTVVIRIYINFTNTVLITSF